MNKIIELEEKIGEFPTGDPIFIKGLKIIGDDDGPKVYIQSALHGAEIQGNSVIYELIEYFKNNSFNGEIILVPHANPFGFLTKTGTHSLGRFDPVTGENWNRNFIDIYRKENNRAKFRRTN